MPRAPVRLACTLLVLSAAILPGALRCEAQLADVYYRPAAKPTAREAKQPTLWDAGLIDIGFNGQIQTTAKLVTIRIGEPGGFNLPLCLLAGATSGDLGASRLNKHTLFQLLDPTGGLLNASAVGSSSLWRSRSGITQVRLAYTGSIKMLAGRDSASGDARTSAAAYLACGLFFQTGAWLGEDGYQDGGVAWFEVDYAAALADASDLRAFFGEQAADSPNGLRMTAALRIQDRVNVKLAAFVPRTDGDIPGLEKNQYKLAFDYSVARR